MLGYASRQWLLLLFLLLLQQQRCLSLTITPVSRRTALLGTLVALSPLPAGAAAADCDTDCMKNCRLIAPNDTTGYCRENCRDYCEQPDRQDGLSGSVGSERGETGILGFGTVVKGEDRPPSISLPGLDFTSQKGKKLIGYD